MYKGEQIVFSGHNTTRMLFRSRYLAEYKYESYMIFHIALIQIGITFAYKIRTTSNTDLDNIQQLQLPQTLTVKITY